MDSLSEPRDVTLTESAGPYRSPPTLDASDSTSVPVLSLSATGLVFGCVFTLIAALFIAYMVSIPFAYPGFSDPTVPYSHWPWLNFLYSGFFAGIAAIVGIPLVLVSMRPWRRSLADFRG